MARVRVIVLDTQSLGDGGGANWRVAFWADVPAARQPFYAAAGATSAWGGATAGDLAALQSGAVVERVETVQQNAGQTLGQLQPIVEAMWTQWQAHVTAANPWVRYGTTWDGTSWVVGGVN